MSALRIAPSCPAIRSSPPPSHRRIARARATASPWVWKFPLLRRPPGFLTLSVVAPTSVRGGLIWEARFDVHAVRTIRDARLVLDSDWLEANTVNTIEPSPSQETSRNGALELDLGRVPAGRRHLLFMQFQTNPTNVGRRTVTVALLDGNEQLLRISRTLTVFP